MIFRDRVPPRRYNFLEGSVSVEPLDLKAARLPNGFAQLLFSLIFAAVLPGGCGSISNAKEAWRAAHTRREHIKLRDEQGALSYQQGRAIIANLEIESGANKKLAQHVAFEQKLTGSPLVVGNKVGLLQNGKETYRAMFNAIEGADDSINLETFEFFDDPIGQEFAEALIAKQRGGIQVNVIYDGFGSMTTSGEFFNRMRESGIRVLQFNPPSPTARRFHWWSTTHRDHRKLMIIDGKTAILGGINLSNVYSSSISSHHEHEHEDLASASLDSWRDTDVEIQGPAVAECQKLFMNHWDSQQGHPLSQRNYFPQLDKQGEEVVRIIATSPGDSSVIYITMISAINNADTNAYITDAYFGPDSQIIDAMKSAAERGVDVRLLVPGQADSRLISAAARSHYSQLMNSGVRIYEWRGKMLHAKTATVDSVWSTVGSSNLDWWSIARNDEVNATILGTDFGARMDQMFSDDLKNAEPIDSEKWKSRGIWERLTELFGRLVEPML